MGQKVNPVGMRIGVNRDWNSRWYANDNDYHVFLNQDIKIRNYLKKTLKDAGVSHIDIERVKTDKGYNVIVTVFAVRIGIVIGQDGKNINELKKEFYIPYVVDVMIKSGKASCEVLSSPSRWFGVTYKEDRPGVVAKFAELVAKGVYPSPLY